MMPTPEDFLSALNQPPVDEICRIIKKEIMEHIDSCCSLREAKGAVKKSLDDQDSMAEGLKGAVGITRDGGNFTEEDAIGFLKHIIDEFPSKYLLIGTL